MARGIKLTDTVYEVDNGTPSVTATAILTTMLLRMDIFNLGTDVKKLTKSNTTVATVQAHVRGNLNTNEFGVHPRMVEAELEISAASSACYGGTQKRKVLVVIPTLTQFNKLKVFDKAGAASQTDTTLMINHSNDGQTAKEYKILRKIPQRLV